LIFVTKYRPGVLGADMLRSRHDGKACGDFSAELREFNGEDDHVHLLAAYPTKVSASALINSLKDVPTRRLRAEFTSCEIRTSCTASPGPVVRRCVLRRRPAEH